MRVEVKMRVMLAGFLLAFFQAHSQDPKSIREAHFPSPDTAFTTPAFSTRNDFTNSELLLEFLDKEASAAQGWVRDTIGMSAKGVPIVAVQKGGEGAVRPVRVLMLGGIHGDEPAGTEGLLAMMQQLAPGGPWAHLLDNVVLRVVPMVNPDGMNRQNRYAANGLDLNRDQSKLVNTEMIALKRDFKAFDADVVIDFHEYRPYRADYVDMGTFGVTSPFDVMFMYSGNLNVPEAIRSATESLLVDPARAEMARSGRRHANYFRPVVIRGQREFRSGGTSPRSSVTSFGLASSLAVLMEIRGVGLGRKGFERRVETAMLLAHSYLKSSSASADAIFAARTAARGDLADVVIEAKRSEGPCVVELLDLQSEKVRTFNEVCSDSNDQTPERTRPRPAGYVLLPGQDGAAERLDILGLDLVLLSEDMPGVSCGVYDISEDRPSPDEFEGFHERLLDAVVRDSVLDLPAGSWYVSADQPRYPLTFELLEPEATNGFARFLVLDFPKGGPFPVVRVHEPLNFPQP